MATKKTQDTPRIQYEERTYHITGTSPILGTKPADKNVYATYIASRAPEGQDTADELDGLPEEAAKGVTVFLRERKTGALCIQAYHIKGFLKEALAALKGQLDIAAPASKVDGLVSVSPAYPVFMLGDQPIMEADEQLERPIRANIPNIGPRTALGRSEMLWDGWELTFTICLCANGGTAKSKPLTFEAIEAALDYGGKFRGLGQWRNAQHGLFTWERVDDE